MPITIIYVIIIALKVYNKKIRQKGEHFEKKKKIKNCQEISTKNIFMNFKILPLNHRFPKVSLKITSVMQQGCNSSRFTIRCTIHA